MRKKSDSAWPVEKKYEVGKRFKKSTPVQARLLDRVSAFISVKSMHDDSKRKKLDKKSAV